MNQYFQKAEKIWADGRSRDMNVTCFFIVHFPYSENVRLTITACSFYRAYLNGQVIAYGPARAAHSVFRVDVVALKNLQAENALVVEVAGYNCRSFYSLNEPSFLQAEISGKNLLKATGFDFDCYVSPWRYRKVTRFSYQRAFSESYKFDQSAELLYKKGQCSLPTSPIEIIHYGSLISRDLNMPKMVDAGFMLKESGKVFVDPNKKMYRDRYMILPKLKIFPFADLDVNPNDLVSSLGFAKEKRKGRLGPMEYSVFQANHSYTGFIGLRADVDSDVCLYVIFDEIPSGKQNKTVTFYRNTTHNIISYELKKGSYDLLSFEPYTAQYIQVIVISGNCLISQVRISRYENPEASKLKFHCADPKLNSIIEAARNTFSQNAVDILTDCPSRERAGWLCDSYFSGRAEQLFTGSNKTERNFLENYVRSPKLPNLPKGMLPMCYPADFEDGTFIPNWALWFILELADYRERTGDHTLIEASRKKVMSLLEYFKGFLNDDGLLENLKGWVFVEWSKANDADYVSGVNYPSNMLYAKALQCAGQLFDIAELTCQAEKIRATIRKQSYNGEFFEDNKIHQDGKMVSLGHVTETCQYYAFYFDIASIGQFPELFDKLLKKFGPRRDAALVYPQVFPSNVFIGDYLRLDYLRKNGYLEQAAEETVEYFYQMAKTTGTLWEHASPEASLNHCFASYIANIIIESVCGIHKVDNDKKTIHLSQPALQCDFKLSLPINGDHLVYSRLNGAKKLIIPLGYHVINEKGDQ